MKTGLLVLISFITIKSFSQNVGIGTTTPGFPLSFSNDLGSKISLYGASGNHYGLGIQNGLFQMYSDGPGANIAFGFGSSNSFTERMKIYNTGPDAMLAQGRITLRNGTTPLNQAYGPGIWLSRADNTANLGFMGTQNNQNIGFYGGPAGWGFTYDAVNSRVGIGNQNPNAALSFAATLGRKITFYPGTIGNAGIGVYANELRIHSDHPNADISFGYENTGGTYTERMRLRGNGELVLMQSSGNPGQVITSNGPGQPATWSNKPYTIFFNQNGNVSITGTALTSTIPGIDGQQIVLNQYASIVFSTTLYLAANVFGSPRTESRTEIRNALNEVVAFAHNKFQFHDYNGQSVLFQGVTGMLPPGVYYIHTNTKRFNTIDGELLSWTSGACQCQGGQFIAQVFPL